MSIHPHIDLPVGTKQQNTLFSAADITFNIACQVVGIEMNASAVSDAHRNAEINGLKNCRFVCGKVRFFFNLAQSAFMVY